jgi:uncharacterized membrane protein
LAPAAARCNDGALGSSDDGGFTMKIATYGTMHLGVAFGVAWALTGDLAVAGAIAMVEPAVQTVAYAIHERAWRDPGAIGAALRRLSGRLRGAAARTVPAAAAGVGR